MTLFNLSILAYLDDLFPAPAGIFRLLLLVISSSVLKGVVATASEPLEGFGEFGTRQETIFLASRSLCCRLRRFDNPSDRGGLPKANDIILTIN